jgi:hypothetical protein
VRGGPDLVAALARPIVRGLLSVPEAEAALAMKLLEEDRLGLGDGDGAFDERFAIACGTLQLNVKKLSLLHLGTVVQIERAAIPMIATRPLLPPGPIRAQAHDINAEQDRDAQLTEHQVEDVLQNLLLERRLLEEEEMRARREQALLATAKAMPGRRLAYGRR